MEALLSNQPFASFYLQILALVCVVALAVVTGLRQRSRSSIGAHLARIEMLALAGLILLRLAPALTPPSAAWSLPIERVADMGSLALLAWVFVPALHNQRWRAVAWLAFNALLSLAYLSATALAAPGSLLPASDYNLALPARLWSIWQVVAGVATVIGLALPADEPAPRPGLLEMRTLAFVALGAFLIGYDFHLLTLVGALPEYPPPDNVAAWARCGQLFAYPLLMGALCFPLLASRHSRAKPAPPGRDLAAGHAPSPFRPISNEGAAHAAASAQQMGPAGHLDDALETAARCVEMAPTQIDTRFERGLKLLSSGHIEAAYTEYANAMADAAASVAAGTQDTPSRSSLWGRMDYSAARLDRLLARLCEEPGCDTTGDEGGIATAAQCLRNQIKSLCVALEYTGRPPQGHVTARLTPFEFATARHNPQSDVLDYVVCQAFPHPTQQVFVLFDYEGMQDGQNIVWKTFVDGKEEPSLRMAHLWSLGARGKAVHCLQAAGEPCLRPGTYTLEMYVQAYLVQWTGFSITKP